MSKKSKAISKQKNLQKKRALKASNRAKYATWAALGENSKSARSKRKAKGRRHPNKGKHLIANCGNIACKRCFIVDNKGVRSRKLNERQAYATV